mgnify:FL=1
MYKMCYEQTITVALGTWWELKHRKERIKVEWSLACLNILALCLCNAAIVWSLAPCRSYGSTFKFNLQNTIQKLPNNVFERSYAFREFDMLKRIQSVFYKAGELCLAGMLTGAVSGGLTKLATHNHDKLVSYNCSWLFSCSSFYSNTGNCTQIPVSHFQYQP